MLIVINPDKLTQTPFFQQVINFLWDNEGVTLRHIKKAFLMLRLLISILKHLLEQVILFAQKNAII